MTDKFSGAVDSVEAPATDAASVTPSDTAALSAIPKALYVGGAGDITLRPLAGAADVVLKSVPAGAILPVRAKYVRATGTTATAIVALL